MKTILLTLASVLLSISAFANGNKTSSCMSIPAGSSAHQGTVQANIFALQDQKVGVVVVQDQVQEMAIEVRDSESNLVFSEKVLESSFRQNLNLRQLDKGTYTIKVQTSGQCFIKDLEVR